MVIWRHKTRGFRKGAARNWFYDGVLLCSGNCLSDITICQDFKMYTNQMCIVLILHQRQTRLDFSQKFVIKIEIYWQDIYNLITELKHCQCQTNRFKW